ncbi:Phosphate regulon transcriptional regulatory protein PhoB (SphR) [hydrothermal vent metagenome]|uniref:Phosphate regulon transcriptional regulatory protein PhoB (SphR) n=1 Tax=hydrothermal vent metagenome TaxID=652676 RepID=A0A1W1CQI0_9ZZZZ
MKLLIIEDDENILSLLTRGFEEDDYIVDSAMDGKDGEYMALLNAYDVIISDWMLPSKSGIEVVQSLREKNITVPVIMLSAKGDIEDKIKGLKYGADDYLAKPFSFAELSARVEALHRRNSSKGLNLITLGTLSINTDTKTVTKDSQTIELTAKEYELLLFLIKNKNSYVSNSMIEEQLWNNQEYINSNVIQVTIYNLRKKLSKELIKSTRGLGYKIAV